MGKNPDFKWTGVRYVLLAMILYFKIMLFHFCIFDELYTSSSFTPFYNFFDDFLTKILVAFFMATTVFLSRKIWLSLLPLLFVDIWALCNLVYFGANQLFIDPKAMQLVGNMKGYWSSVFTYFQPIQLLFLVSTIVYIVADYFLPRANKNSLKAWGISVGASALLCLILQTPIWHRNYFLDLPGIRSIEKNWGHLPPIYSQYGIRYFIPFYHDVYLCASGQLYLPYDIWAKQYIHNHSIVHYFMGMFVYEYFEENLNIYMTEEEESRLLINGDVSNSIVPSENLIIIVVESLESWAIKDTICGQDVMPNLSEFCQNQYNHIFRCDSVQSIVRHGVSGDGQMMLNSGLLPVTMGATNQFYHQNVYPNFAHLYHQSVIVAPSNTWNQKAMTQAYQYDQVIMPEPLPSEENQMADTLTAWLKGAKEPYCAMWITRASHSPYSYLSVHNLPQELTFPTNLSTDIANYLNCLHYTDQCLYSLFNEYLTPERLKNTTVLITGDHTIFKQNVLDQVSPLVSTRDYTVHAPSYVPLIIYSPTIQNHIDLKAGISAYQADIFPTILNLVGLSAYPWHGFGLDLIHAEGNERPWALNDAFRVSEHLIKTNYFKDKKEWVN